jgi:tetratricopeptide (TPR) repeat protein
LSPHIDLQNNVANHDSLGQSLTIARHYDEAIAALKEAKILAPRDSGASEWLGFAYYWSGHFQSARAACEPKAGENGSLLCLAMTYHKLGEQPKAEEMLGKFRAFAGDSGAVLYAMIYAEWGDSARALDWLGTGMRLHDPLLAAVKVASPFDLLRKEPRFQAIERELKFPD